VQPCQRAVKGRSPMLFSSGDRERSGGRKLSGEKQKRLMELRRSYSTDPLEQSASRKVHVCMS